MFGEQENNEAVLRAVSKYDFLTTSIFVFDRSKFINVFQMIFIYALPSTCAT